MSPELMQMIASGGLQIITTATQAVNDKDPEAGFFAFYKGGTTPPVIVNAEKLSGSGQLSAAELLFLNNEVANQQYFLIRLKNITLSSGKICMVRNVIK